MRRLLQSWQVLPQFRGRCVVIVRGVPLLIVCSFCVSGLAAGGTWAGAAEEVVAFANEAASELGSSPLPVPQFESATVDAVEDLGRTDDCDRYLCWLKNSKGRAGYMAVAARAGSYQVLAFSATPAPPEYFLKHLRVPELAQPPVRFARATQISFVERVPLVAALPIFFGGKPIEMSELAASLSSVFNYLQSEKKILLFGHPGFEEDIEYTQRFKEDPASTREPDDPNWQSFDQERCQVIARENIPQGQTADERAASRLHQQSLIRPIIRRRLLDPVNARERLEVLRAEWMGINKVTRIDISKGMKDAVLLEANYLDNNGSNLEQNLKLFFQTRGRTVDLQMGPFEPTQANSVPAILIGPGNVAGAVLGFADIDGQRFAFVFFPKTGSPIRMTLADKLRAIRVAKGLSPEPNEMEREERIRANVKKMRETQEHYRRLSEERGIPYQPPIEDPERWLREGVERIEAMRQKMPVVEDRRSASAAAIENGVHLVRYSALASWKVLGVAKLEVGDNWGQAASR